MKAAREDTVPIPRIPIILTKEIIAERTVFHPRFLILKATTTANTAVIIALTTIHRSDTQQALSNRKSQVLVRALVNLLVFIFMNLTIRIFSIRERIQIEPTTQSAVELFIHSLIIVLNIVCSPYIYILP